MDYYNQSRYELQDEYNMDQEFEMETNFNDTEFNYEQEQDYEMLPDLELNDEMEFEQDNEFEADYELNDEYDPMNEASDYGELEFENGGYRDEMEAELEYVTNEEEFGNWVNEIIVRDHRNRNLRPVMKRPIVQRAVRQLSRIASKTLPYLGRRVGGWKGAWRPSAFRGQRRINPSFRPRPGYGRRYPYPVPYGSSMPPAQPPYYPPDPGQQNTGYPGMDAPPPQQGDQDGSFKNFVVETIKNLSQQIAAGNESLAALKTSMVNSAVNNFPAVVQPKGDAPPTEGPPPPAPGAPQGEFEFEDYEYDRETDDEYGMGTEGEVRDSEGSFNEETEIELATELLSVQSDQELDHFLGSLLKKAVGAVSGILKTDQGKILKGVLKSVAKKVIPLAGTAAGTFFGGPVGAALGGKIGNAAAGLFELELEGMSSEDREFETAKAMVRFGGNAARQVTDHMSGNPREDVRQGVMEAATRFAPGLLMRRGRRRLYDHDGRGNVGQGGSNGTWYRKGNRIIIEDI